MARVYLALGSNEGDRRANLEEALCRLARRVALERVSSIYETEPWGYRHQPWFLNAVCVGTTSLSPHRLLQEAKRIEQAMGRRRTGRYGPRPIDIDLLLYGEGVVSEPELEVPHPRMAERAFVLVPLVELEPHLRHPVLAVTVEELLRRVGDTGTVYRVGTATRPCARCAG